MGTLSGQLRGRMCRNGVATVSILIFFLIRKIGFLILIIVSTLVDCDKVGIGPRLVQYHRTHATI